ncbi:MAG: CopD family protein [Pseudophaeobacter sp. bin_em_oilr2.035]|uniref:CopD family protein n=1 Tax=Phaeobacter gallaeciensis TaxID=60890 RepID=A0ABD4XFJ5_9RHOB|nr:MULTISPECIES: CopD family protein [Phaeobacter]MDF1774290.1 CopD family protein [Pseudophaeobacter sp. bin_em_oilr2.035]MEE2818947.1 CopD family protein [Pseudomonadota bacterium]MDE4063230.1 CopD family protein [Phaeobacter gallaeciensis]MDE4126226.1 CopD family protein [Phaeobacter gallaeciensis]MDE4130707.1 CopD family protein [Phaeobacter gallaeciensis]
MVSGSFETSAQLSHRFGQTARLVVPGLILAGHIMAWLLLGGLAALFSTPYGLALVCKQALVAGRSPPAAANKLHFIPAMQRGDRNAVHHLPCSSIVEAFVILLILTASAYLTNSLSLPG